MRHPAEARGGSQPGQGQKQSLLDDEDDGQAPSLNINENFAKRFEHNKQREELHRLQAKHPELAHRIERQAFQSNYADEEEESSTSEEEDDGEIPEETEAQIFQTLLRIRSKDPSIYDSSVHFFKDDKSDDDNQISDQQGVKGGLPQKEKKSKPQYLKDVLAKQALEHGPELASEDEEEEGGGKRRPAQVYDEEQEKLRAAFLSAAQDDDEGDAEDGFGGVLKKRGTHQPDQEEEEEEQEEQEEGEKKPKSKKAVKKKVEKLVDQYFGGPAADESDAFLRDFILNKGWVDRDEQGYVPTYNEVVGSEEVDDEADEAHLQQTDHYEAAYNFRFEEPGGNTIVTHPRAVEGTVRRVDERRKKSREAKKERQREALNQHEEEIKRLKNLKKKEIEERLAKVAKVAGASWATDGDEDGKPSAAGKGKKKGVAGVALRLDPKLLEGDFDPEEWDKQMAAAFDDEYYEGEDEDLDALLGGDDDDDDEDDNDGDVEVDKLLGPLPEGEEEEEEGGEEDAEGEGKGDVSFQALRKKLTKKLKTEEEDVEGLAGTSGRSAEAAAAAAATRAELSQLLEEYYKLDHEGVAGGIKTRFRYRQVPAASYGLTLDDILMRPDRELNQVASIKRMAPYRDDLDAKQRPNYKALQELKSTHLPDGRQQKRQWGKGQGQREGKPAWAAQWNSGGGGGQGGGGAPHHHSGGDKKHKQARGKPAPAGAPAASAAAPLAGAAPGGATAGAAAAAPAHERTDAQGKAPKDKATGDGSGKVAKSDRAKQGNKAKATLDASRKAGRPTLDPLESRKASYAALTIPKGAGGGGGGGGGAGGGGDGGKKKRKQGPGADGQQQQQQGGKKQRVEGGGAQAGTGAGGGAVADGLSKAHRKNLKRAQKRAAAKTAAPAPAAP